MADEKARKRATTHRVKMRNDNERKTVWISKANCKRLEILANRKGLINESGINAGKPSVQKAMEAVVKAGLDTLEKQ